MAYSIAFAYGGCLLVPDIHPSPPVGAGYGICPLHTLCAFMALSLVTPPLQMDHHHCCSSPPPARPFSCTPIITDHQLGHQRPPERPVSSVTLGKLLYLHVPQCPHLGSVDCYTAAPDRCYKDWLK